MAYQPVEGLEIEQDSEKPRSRGRVLGAVAVLVLLVVLVLALLMLTRCADRDDAERDGGSVKRIVAVPERPAEPGVISVWISDAVTIDAALRAAGLSKTGARDLGDGRYVVNVERGTERDSARKLQAVDGVYDAGFVFSEEEEDAR